MLLSWVASDQGLPDPGMLNTWLRDNGGYYGCGLIWAGADDYDGDGAGLEYLWSLPLGFDDWVSLDVELETNDRIGPSGVPSSYLVLDSNQSYSSDRTLADYPSGDRTIFRLATFSGIFPFGEITDRGRSLRPGPPRDNLARQG
ncbi:MAG: hypothetical protein KOO60_14380 [Gemmatimonadales bacterium]|nr:hypothetical protein [Gemmatimonadales bacterium]